MAAILDATQSGGEVLPTRERRAFVTLLTNDAFLPGAEVMLHSLRATKTEVELAVLVTADVTKHARAKLAKRADVLIDVEPIANPHAATCHVDGWVDSGFTKLRVWALAQYDVVVYIDADALVLEPIDELFERAVDFAAAPDVFPPDRFNAGVLLVRPDPAVFAALLAAAPDAPSHDGGDTGFLNAFFPDWFASPPQARLPFGYNAQRTLHWMTHTKCPGYWEAVRPLKIVHYCSSPKPWDAGASKKGELEMLWWQHFLQTQVPDLGLAMGGGSFGGF